MGFSSRAILPNHEITATIRRSHTCGVSMKCWEFKKCGREKGGARAAELGVCPAWPNGGQACAKVAGTLCGGKVQGTFATKLASCMSCAFYRSASYDHGRLTGTSR